MTRKDITTCPGNEHPPVLNAITTERDAIDRLECYRYHDAAKRFHDAAVLYTEIAGNDDILLIVCNHWLAKAYEMDCLSTDAIKLAREQAELGDESTEDYVAGMAAGGGQETEFAIVKRLLKEANVEPTPGYPPEANATHVNVLPILHYPGKIVLQFSGWAIHLSESGCWEFEDTLGG